MTYRLNYTRTWSRLTGVSLENKIAGLVGFGAMGKQALHDRLAVLRGEELSHRVV